MLSLLYRAGWSQREKRIRKGHCPCLFLNAVRKKKIEKKISNFN